MNPKQVKRREYFGLAGLTLGLLNVIAGIVGLLFLLPLGLTLVGLGSALTAAGVFVLTRIPDVLATPDELWP